jgi:hypothetical protein
VHLFAYGSLLDPGSLARTVPDVRAGECIPALLAGHVRVFDVAFPNDGSQGDKAYVDGSGDRPPVVLFANIRPAPGATGVNGILIPVDTAGLEALRRRERRYEVRDVTEGIRLHDRRPRPRAVAAFVGAPAFTGPEQVRQGVVARRYAETIDDGIELWDLRHPGFRLGFETSTIPPPPDRVVDLRRIDRAG